MWSRSQMPRPACVFLGQNLPSCLVLDVQLPDISGLDLQAGLAADLHSRIVFLTGHPSSVRACKAGAVDVLTEPFDTPNTGCFRVIPSSSTERG